MLPVSTQTRCNITQVFLIRYSIITNYSIIRSCMTKTLLLSSVPNTKKALNLTKKELVVLYYLSCF